MVLLYCEHTGREEICHVITKTGLWNGTLIKASRALCRYSGLEKMTTSVEGTCTWGNFSVTQPSLQITGLQQWHCWKDFPMVEA